MGKKHFCLVVGHTHTQKTPLVCFIPIEIDGWRLNFLMVSTCSWSYKWIAFVWDTFVNDFSTNLHAVSKKNDWFHGSYFRFMHFRAILVVTGHFLLWIFSWASNKFFRMRSLCCIIDRPIEFTLIPRFNWHAHNECKWTTYIWSFSHFFFALSVFCGFEAM